MEDVLRYMKDYGGIGLGCAAFAVFLVLKVADVIDWSWWWVVSPLWVPLAIDFVLSVAYVLYNVHVNNRDSKETENETAA